MINLKIDPEFQSQIPPLTDDEFHQLEENILKEGKLLSPLIVWNNTLVDGHNRYAILQKHPEICFSTMPLRFANREEALAWICKNQLGRRNLSPEQKRYLLGKQYESEKKAEKIFHGNQYTLAKKSGGSHDDTHHSGKKTCDRIAEENGVSRASVLRASSTPYQQISPAPVNPYVALPGTSEHQSGLALDVSCPAVNHELITEFAETPEGKWLVRNASLYGFIIRYPANKESVTGIPWEPWHIRYVTRPLASCLALTGLTLEEYYTTFGAPLQNPETTVP